MKPSARLAVLLTAAVLALPACSGTPRAGGPSSGPGTAAASGDRPSAPASASPATSAGHPSSSPASASGAASARPPAPAACVTARVDAMTPEQRAGQLVMVGYYARVPLSAVDASIRRHHIGGLLLLGGWHGADTVRAATRHAQDLADGAATAGVGELVTADQEGAGVLQLQGAGFTAPPPATVQGAQRPEQRTGYGRTMGAELKAAGVNVDLAPIADTVDPALGRANGPIGFYRRQYALDPAANAAAVADVTRGLRASGVQATAKHFPGIGRIRNNTDHYAAGITDTTTTADDAALQPFAAAIEAGAGLVMVGTANYARIDPGVPAALSKPIVTGLLRERLGFTGVVVTDDLDARAVAALPAADKAVRAIEAGGDIVLTSLVGTGPVLAQALVDKARTDPGFAAAVRASAVRVVALKAGLGLVPGCRG